MSYDPPIEIPGQSEYSQMEDYIKQLEAELEMFNNILTRWWEDELTGEEACLKMLKQQAELGFLYNQNCNSREEKKE